MAGSVIVQSVNSVTGISGSKQVGPFTLSGASSILGILDVAVAGAGPLNVVTPPGATWAFIVLPMTNVSTVTIKGVGADTGIPAQQTGCVAIISFANPAVANSFTINFGGAVAGGNVEITYI